MVPGNFGWGYVVLARIATFAPSLAQALAIASPIPLDAPVTTMVFPLRGLSSWAICYLRTESLFISWKYDVLIKKLIKWQFSMLYKSIYFLKVWDILWFGLLCLSWELPSMPILSLLCLNKLVIILINRENENFARSFLRLVDQD